MIITDENPNVDISKMSEEDKMEHEERLKEVIEQLDLIDAADAPSKATLILVGLGFTVENLNL